MTDQWTVLTSSAHMPSSCKGNYRNVAVVKLTLDYAEAGKRPATISERAEGIVEVIHLGAHHVGTTPRCAYQRALSDAANRAAELNAEACTVVRIAPLSGHGNTN